MTSLSELKFFTTPEHDCSYLPNKQAITLFVDPLAEIDTQLYTDLSEVGFRRSGSHIYRPYCKSCSACIPVRLPISLFTYARRQKRTLKRNQDIKVRSQIPLMTEENFALYQRYIEARHGDGDMYPASQDQFMSFLVDGRPEATFFEFRASGRLIAVAVADQLDNGLSAIYTYFDPEEEKRSPGSLAILWLIDEAKRLGLEYLYLGYWIKQSQKMSYKMDYQPLEMFINNHWVPISR